MSTQEVEQANEDLSSCMCISEPMVHCYRCRCLGSAQRYVAAVGYSSLHKGCQGA
jgi:hypothetical protein